MGSSYYRCSQLPATLNAQGPQRSFSRKSIWNGRLWRVNFDPFALIRVCLCGKRFPNGRIGFQSVAVLGMRNGTSQSPFRPALGRQLVRAADAPLRGHGFGTSRLRQTPTTNGLTAYRMRLHLACVSSGTYGPFATSASRSRLRLPRTTRLALRASLAGSGCYRYFGTAVLRPYGPSPGVHSTSGKPL